jgi:cyclophilin family peptidyl-prolyl cis-trans isomerase
MKLPLRNSITALAFAALFASCGGSADTSEATKERTISERTVESENNETKQPIPERKQSMENPVVVLQTSLGNIEVELAMEEAPITVANFLSYVESGHYNGTIFHRVMDGFMIQGGGFTPDGVQKPTQAPIVLESQNGLKNRAGTVAMARTNAPNSATSQFFINVKDNSFLDYTQGNPGYAVFGHVVDGSEVVNLIRQVPTGNKGPHQNWPLQDVVIEKAYVQGQP